MTTILDDPGTAWKRFVVDHGHQADVRDLAFILSRPVEDITRLRASGACSKGQREKKFAELFQLWHGREPGENDWPAPRKVRRGEYEWQAPELALLASLVGRLGKDDIAQTLTERLKRLADDPDARRSAIAVQNTISRIGMQSGDVVGGITTAAAAREIGSLAMVNQAIAKGDLRAARVGRRWVIPHKVWAAWKAKRVFPPDGYVQLSTLKQTLSIRSDKLSEFARMGYVPTAIRCNPYGTGQHSTQFGTWFIDPEVAKAIVDDRHAGRPMPWHGKAIPENLRATYRLWQERKHPKTCKTCNDIWGRGGAPKSFEEYEKRYPPLAHGAKRHLTLHWAPGLTVGEIARKAGCAAGWVRRAIANGTLEATEQGDALRASKTAATRWISRGCPFGEAQHSWLSLTTASKRYLFTERELKKFIAQGRLKSKTGTQGAMRGIVYISRQQCAALREQAGFTEQEAARRAGVTVPQLRETLRGVDWRNTGAIPLVTVQAVIKRLQSRQGYTIEEAAKALGKDASWVKERIKDGTVRLLRTTWEASRLYLSEPMMARLRAADADPKTTAFLGKDWLRLSEAAREAGVTNATIVKWGNQGELKRVHEPTGWRYARDAVRARARTYWQTVRLHRATQPLWLQAETGRPT
jgi:hypothetical protein